MVGHRGREQRSGKPAGRGGRARMGMESNRREECDEKRGLQGCIPHYDAVHPRIKNPKFPPLFHPFPLFPAGCCAVSGTLTHCATDTERALDLI